MNLSNQLFESDDVNYKVYNTLNNAAFVIVLFANDHLIHLFPHNNA